MQVRFSREFRKSYLKTDKKIRLNIDKRIKIFLKNPFDPQLNNHALTGKYSGRRSINITGDWRAIYTLDAEKGDRPIAIFEALGTHSQLYQ
jgi:addiction module RelE/StbE family toxin